MPLSSAPRIIKSVSVVSHNVRSLLIPVCFCLAPAAWGQSPAAPGVPPLTLSAAVAQALAVNPASRTANQQLAVSEAQLAQAQAQRRFQITFNSTAGVSNANVIQPPPSQETFGTLQNTVTVPLPTGARPRLLVQQAQSQLDAARAQFESARFALAAQTGAAYYDLLRSQALLLIAQETLAGALRQLSDTRKRFGAGDVPDLDVLRAQVPVAAAQAQQYQAETDEAVARQALNSLIGQPLDTPLSLADVSPDVAARPLPLTLDQARAQAQQFSPDIRAAEATVRADRSALAAARLFREPTFSLQAIDIRSNDQTSFSRLDTLQAAVTVPLSDGGLGRAQVREAEAALSAAQAQEETARQGVLVRVSAAYLTVQSARRQVTAAQAARDIAQISDDKTRQGYQNGLFPLTDVLNAQAASTQARIAYTQALYGAAVAVGNLNAALNGAGDGLGVVGPGTTAPGMPGAGANSLATPGAGNAGTSPAGANAPGTTPAGNSTTGNNPNGANAGGRGGP